MLLDFLKRKNKDDQGNDITNAGLNASSMKLNVKGKTAEKLGVIGNENAIASEVILSMIKYD